MIIMIMITLKCYSSYPHDLLREHVNGNRKNLRTRSLVVMLIRSMLLTRMGHSESCWHLPEHKAISLPIMHRRKAQIQPLMQVYGHTQVLAGDLGTSASGFVDHDFGDRV